MSPVRLLWGHLRPAGMPWVVLLPVIGWFYAHWTLAADVIAPSEMARVAVAWACLHAAAMYQNAVFDVDEGDVLFGAPRAAPPWLGRVGFVLGVVAVAVAASAGQTAGACALGNAILAVGYSHPRLAWKAHPIGGPLVNVLGYGVLSPVAGWSLVGAPVELRAVLGLVALVCLVAASWLVAQAFQEADDRRRGYHTFVADFGAVATLRGARVASALGFGLGGVLAMIGWYPRPCLIGLGGALWVDRAISAWIADGNGSERRARAVLVGLVWSGVLFIVGACLEYVREDLSGQPLCGLGTTYPRMGW